MLDGSMVDDQDVASAANLARLLRQLKRRDARRRGGAELTYRALAARTGWSTGILAHYFTGKTIPPTDRFDVLVRALGATPAEQGALATLRDRVDERRRDIARRDAPDGTRDDSGGAGESRDAGGTRDHSGGVGVPDRGIRLLGPVQAFGPHGPAALVGARQQALVALLALRVGTPVSRSRLVDALWGEAPPRTAVGTLYSHVARVRRALDDCGLAGALVTRASGYELNLRPDAVDATRLEDLAERGRKALANGATVDAVNHLVEGLALWRGTPLAGVEPTGWAADEVERLGEVRLGALEDLWEARLSLGQAAAAVGELERLVSAHPTRERLAGLLMTTLYGCGQHARAVDAYRRLRDRLAEELGVEPSPDLQRLHAAVLRRELDPAPSGHPVKPAQLPAPVGHFTGRTRELATLDTLLELPGRIGVVAGPAGMGKTSLAVAWADRVADRFRDGQIMLDLRGHDPASALPVGEALTFLLTALGTPAGRIPSDVDGQLGLYRSVLRGRRTLIVLDNAGTADQVAPLHPPGASLLLVTSRNQLAALAVEHEVTFVDLDVLSPDEANELLCRVLGRERVTRESAAAAELERLCERMPLALRIAAARLSARPLSPIAAVVADLRGGDRLGALSVPGESRSIRAAFASAYRALSPAAARLFGRLGRHPGPTFGVDLAAAAVGEAGEPTMVAVGDRPGAIRPVLDELVGAHLVVDLDAGRYRLHDLIRLYAAERLNADEARQASARIVDWYLGLADGANRVLEPARDRAAVHLAYPASAPVPADPEIALGILDAERPNLLPVARHAAQHGHDREIWQLSYVLTSYYTRRGHWTEQLEYCREGLAAALRLDDPVAERLMCSGLGVALSAVRRPVEALQHLERALVLMRAGGDRRGQAMALNNIALAYGQLGQLDAAADRYRQAHDLHLAEGHAAGVALALHNLGYTYGQMGLEDPAFDHLDRALALAREIGNAHLEACALNTLGETHAAFGTTDRALERFTSALAILRREGARRKEAETSVAVARLHRRAGDHAAAEEHLRQALRLSRDLDDADLEAEALAELTAAASRPADRESSEPPD